MKIVVNSSMSPGMVPSPRSSTLCGRAAVS